MIDTLCASELRRLAAEYVARANDSRLSAAQRDRLRRAHASLLALAASADWLAGRFSPDAC